MADLSPFRRALPPGATLSRWIAPDGWAHRRFDWPGSGRGWLLFQGGRADVIEKYLESCAHFHAQGWSISAFDWRGQGGSGRLSADPRVGHATDLDLYATDLAAFWHAARRTADGTRPAVVVGHSMGGQIVLRALADGGIDPQAAVLSAPMLGLRVPFGPALGARVARYMAGRGDPARAAWKAGAAPARPGGRQALLTHDAARYADEHWWYAQAPELELGPPSWAWMVEAFRATAALAADPALARIATPILMLIAEADRLVDPRAALRIAARLPDAQIVRFGRESAHEILREVDSVRDRALTAIDAFLAARAP